MKKYKKRYLTEYDTALPVKVLVSFQGLINVVIKDNEDMIPFDYAKNEEIQSILFELLPETESEERPRVRSRGGSIVGYKQKKQSKNKKKHSRQRSIELMEIEEQGKQNDSIPLHLRGSNEKIK